MRLTKTEQMILDEIDNKIYIPRDWKKKKVTQKAIDTLVKARMVYLDSDGGLHRFRPSTVAELVRAVDAYKEGMERAQAHSIELGQECIALRDKLRRMERDSGEICQLCKQSKR